MTTLGIIAIAVGYLLVLGFCLCALGCFRPKRQDAGTRTRTLVTQTCRDEQVRETQLADYSVRL